MSGLQHQVHGVDHHPVVEYLVSSHQIEIKYPHGGCHHRLARLHSAERALPPRVGVGRGGGRRLLSGEDHLVEGRIVECHVVWNVFILPPLPDPGAIVHGVVWRPVGVVDHVGGEELRHDLAPLVPVVPLHVVRDDLVHGSDHLLGEGVCLDHRVGNQEDEELF